jgi:hypothetical protein
MLLLIAHPLAVVDPFSLPDYYPRDAGFCSAVSHTDTSMRRTRGDGSLLGRWMCLWPASRALHLTVAGDWKEIALLLDRAARRVAAASLDE